MHAYFRALWVSSIQIDYSMRVVYAEYMNIVIVLLQRLLWTHKHKLNEKYFAQLFQTVIIDLPRRILDKSQQKQKRDYTDSKCQKGQFSIS